jgi:SLT domain-containing protein
LLIQKAQEADKNFKDANTKAEEEGKKVIAFQQKTQQLQKTSDGAKLQAQQATEKANEEQRKAQQAQKMLKMLIDKLQQQ